MTESTGIVLYVEALRSVAKARQQSLDEGYSQATLDQILRSELGRSITRSNVRMGKSGAATEKPE